MEGARAALEKTYRDKGFQTVSVSVPMQRAANGVVFLQVTEAPVGRLRVNGSRFYDINKIKARVPSLAQGTLPNFNKVEREIIALNQSGDLQITPSLAAGVMPGTVDVNLVVKDKFPLHGSVELNNRYSANTTPLRLDLSLRYDNLWQLGIRLGSGFRSRRSAFRTRDLFRVLHCAGAGVGLAERDGAGDPAEQQRVDAGRLGGGGKWLGHWRAAAL